MNLLFRFALGAIALANIVLGMAFAFQVSWALDLWPWTTGRLSYIFVGSILAAIGAGAGWIALSRERGSMPAGMLSLAVMVGSISTYLLIQGSRNDDGQWVAYGVGGAIITAINVVMFAFTYNTPLGERQPLPWLLRGSYIVFVVLLVLVGGSLILQVDGIMPWPVDPDTSVVIGSIFLGDAFYFLYALIRPDWQTARAQLWSFLVYDIILIVPLLGHWTDVPADLRTNLIVYLAVVIYSGALGIYYLIINSETRGWSLAALSPSST